MKIAVQGVGTPPEQGGVSRDLPLFRSYRRYRSDEKTARCMLLPIRATDPDRALGTQTRQRERSNRVGL